MPAWQEGLNPAQLEAVTAGDGPVLVIAGAGTGKTRTLACRVAWLVARGVPPERILLLTFTRRAAAEMLDRADQLTGLGLNRRVWGGTFHGTANRLLRIHGRAVGLPPDFTILDQADAADMINLVRTEAGLPRDRKRFPNKDTLLAIYSLTVNSGAPLEKVLQRRYRWFADCREQIAEIFSRYVRRKRICNVVDYDDLLIYWRELCRHPETADRLEEHFAYILVDEYQDTNPIQAEILQGLRRRNRNIMVVGDDAQAIYSFRAATVRNILDFPRQFPGTRIVTLEQNYRSTRPILALANAVIAQARERFTKNLWSERPSDRRPALYGRLDDAEQAEVVCDRIVDHLEEGIPLHQQAVLFRAGWHSATLEIELARRRIPFRKYGGLRFVEAAHIKDLLAYLRILENPYDELSWFRVLLLLDGVGHATARKIMQAIGVGRQPPPALPEMEAEMAAVEQIRPPPGQTPLTALLNLSQVLPPRIRKPVQELAEVLQRGSLIATLPAEADAGHGPAEKDVPAVADQVDLLMEYYRPILERDHDDWALRLRDLQQFQEIAARYRSRQRFLADLTLDAPSSISDLAGRPIAGDDHLILSTIHSAKGCEWQVVHVIHAVDGAIPSDMALEEEDGLEEERRLFYVALTRARDMLYIYFPQRFYHSRSLGSDAYGHTQPTRFLPPRGAKLYHPRGVSGLEAECDEAGPPRLEELSNRPRRLGQS